MHLKIKREHSTTFNNSELELLIYIAVKQKHIFQVKNSETVTANLKKKTRETKC